MPETAPGAGVYVEVGAKRAFAGAIDWPGWCRGGRDEDAAMTALAEYAQRYARVLRGTRLGFATPAEGGVRIVERLKGDTTTDFGAPSIPPKADATPVSKDDLRRLVALMKACWRTFDAAAGAADGVELAKGPRGGGRQLDAIVEHVRGAEESYLSMIGRKVPKGDDEHAVERTREAVLEGLAVAVRDGVPAAGPRGGARWSVRYLVRRDAWHILDHAWEIEDRAP